MGVDNAGYNTSSLFQAKDYDPTNSALVNGLQSTASYDPTTQSTSLPTSAARFLGQTNSQNTSEQDTASDTQNLQSTNGYGTLNNALSNLNQSSQPTAAKYGLTATSNNALNSSYSSTLPTTSKLVTTPTSTSTSPNTGYTVSVGTGNGVAQTGVGGYVAQQAAANAAYKNSLTAYSGAQIVGVRTKEGGIAYYQFDTSKGSYVFKQMTDKKGNIISGQAMTAVDGNGNTVEVPPTLNDAQRASAQLQTVAGTQITMDSAANSANLINQQSANAQAIATWNKGNQDAYDKQQAAAAATAQSTAQQQALDYMTTHNGQLPPNLQTIANNTYSGSAGIPQAQQAGIAAAQQAYAAQQAHAATLSGLQMGAVDTSAADAAIQASQNSLISQYRGYSGGADAAGGALGALASLGLSGQGQLDHEKAAAASYNQNMAAFNNALTTQNSADQTATGNQLFSDIQGVQQIAAALQQEMGQLGTKAQQQAQGQLDNLQNSLTQYQQAVQEFGQGSAQAMAIAKGILSAAATVAAAVA